MLTSLLSILFLSQARASYNFLSIGDWGGAAITEYTHNVVNVAAQMVKTATASDPAFIVNTGDNFYWCGIQNTSDYQVKVDWVDPYSDPALDLPWYSVLGNHEYGYNVQAQIDLASIYTNWVMDDRYYTRRVTVDEASSTYISFIFLDTSPCISAYRSTKQSGWDPCSTTYPTCSLESSNDDFEGECYFNANILSQSCDDQYAWLQTALAAVPENDWLIVVGHHPLDEIDVLDMTTLVQQHGFSLYLNGHTHSLVHYTVDNAGVYVTSGAGALVNTPDQSHPITHAKLMGESFNTSASHSYQSKFSSKTAGFTQHTFSSDFTTLTTDFISYTGSVIYSITSARDGTYV
eukprot:gene22907-29673_t